MEEVLTAKIDRKIITMMHDADMIWFAGRDNGVAAELALKTNEITRKKSGFLEGTFALHGIEEVMNRGDVLIWVAFPTIVIPDGGDYAEYLQLTAGWNLLVETGISLGIDPDHPVRARKVGNEYVPEAKK